MPGNMRTQEQDTHWELHKRHQNKEQKEEWGFYKPRRLIRDKAQVAKSNKGEEQKLAWPNMDTKDLYEIYKI